MKFCLITLYKRSLVWNYGVLAIIFRKMNWLLEYHLEANVFPDLDGNDYSCFNRNRIVGIQTVEDSK